MATTCDQIGHDFQSTASSGWYRCVRIAGHTTKGLPVFCKAVAVCPGCLGYRIARMSNIFCATHYQVCSFDDFPIVQPSSTSASSGEQSSYEQSSLW